MSEGRGFSRLAPDGIRERRTVKIFVGNLSFDADEHDLHQLFSEFGDVEQANLVRHPRSRHSRGFGFVEMPDPDEAGRAVESLNGKEVMGRALTVNESRAGEAEHRRTTGRRRRMT